MFLVLDSISILHVIWIMTDAINGIWKNKLYDSNNKFYKLDKTGIILNIGNMIKNYDKISANTYKIIEIYLIANKMIHFCIIIEMINAVELIIHLTETIFVTDIIIKEIILFEVIHNKILQRLNRNEIIVFIIVNGEFNAKTDKMNVFYLITNKMNDCIQRLITIEVTAINTITYSIPTSMVSKIVLINTICDIKPTATAIHMLMIEFNSFAIVGTSNGTIAVEFIIERIVYEMVIPMIHILVGTIVVWINTVVSIMQSGSKMSQKWVKE